MHSCIERPLAETVSYLRQPSSPLLSKWLPCVEYRLVALDNLIMVHVPEEAPPTDLLENICMIEVL